jgi:tungstate transport system substrate-binding protein
MPKRPAGAIICLRGLPADHRERLYNSRIIRAGFISRFFVLFVLFVVNNSFAGAEGRLRMSTTTSTENSGLLDVLLPPFEKAGGLKIDVIAVGTGRALKLGENGDVDVVLVHSRVAEERFVAAGFGIGSRRVMYNDFVVVGPPADPAGLEKSGGIAEAFVRLAEGKTRFVSRGDDSGTHKKEKELWKAAGIIPQGKWYIEAGQGMGGVLQMADNIEAYTLTDRGTFLSYAEKLKLVIVFEGGESLFNPYGVIAVNPARHPHVKYKSAKKFIDYLTGPRGRKIIADYKKNGKTLFFPAQ